MAALFLAMAIRRRSFRHNLLVKILSFSLPILFVGQAVALSKARSSLLLSAQQNLTSSAIRKAEALETGIQAIDANIDLLGQTEAFQSNDLAAIQSILDRVISDTKPYDISCVELRPPQAKQALINTCDRTIIPSAKQVPWLQSGSVETADFYVFSPGIDADASEPNTLSSGPSETSEEIPDDRALIKFIVASPIYDKDNDLRYTLAMEVGLLQLQDVEPQSLVGKTIVIDQNQIIVSHPDPARLGNKISDLPEASKFSDIVRDVEADKDGFDEFSYLSSKKENWLLGYSGFDVPVSPKQGNVWTVLAATPTDQALYGLRQIRRVLFVLNIGLFVASILLALYVSRSLSLPVERLIRYTQDIKDLSQLKAAPRSSRIWELDYLGTVLERMLRGLEKNSAELRRAWQDAQTANQLKNEFLANTSHELRTPLNGIIGSIGIIRDGLCDSKEEEREFLSQANKAAMHLLSVIEDILNIAKIEAGTLDMKIAPVDLRTVLQDVLEMETLQARRKGISLIGPELLAPLMILVDHFRFKQVLLNIVSNAIKFTEQGQISIEITTDERFDIASDHPLEKDTEVFMPSGPWVKITITDSGIGIDPEHIPKLFKPFVMVDGSRTRSYEGTGLGLAISQNFMRLMQGDIAIDSKGVGKGTTVTIVMPRLVREVQIDRDEVTRIATGDRDVAEAITR